MKTTQLAALLSVSIGLSACGEMSNKIDASFGPTQDFRKSEIINNGPGVADGQSELLLAILLMNSNGSIVQDFKPTYEITSGAGVSTAACTTSNANGVSTCILKATQPGTKRISITNIKINLEADVVFNNPTFKPIFGVTSSGKKQASGAFTLTATVGSQEPGSIKKNGSYTLFGGVQGEGYSR